MITCAKKGLTMSRVPVKVSCTFPPVTVSEGVELRKIIPEL